MGERLIIYGATGYSGRLIAQQAAEQGLQPIACGRDTQKTAIVARSLSVESRTATVADPASLDCAFADASVVINAAGPFSDTAAPIAAACLRRGAHYLDITAEVPVMESLAALHLEATSARIMIMPGVGFDVVPTDCLSVYVARRLGRVRRLAVAVTGLAYITRGSAKTLIRAIDGGLVRRAGRLVHVALGSIERSFDFPDGRKPTLNVSLGDLASAYYSTGATELETYVEATPLIRSILLGARTFGPVARMAPWQAVLMSMADLLPVDPTQGPNINGAGTMGIVAEAHDDHGNRAAARLQTPEPYRFTAVTAVAIARRAMDGDIEYGFQTPGRVYGSEFVLGFAGVRREDLA